MTSALLFVAVLVLVEFSYHLWTRRTISRRETTAAAIVDVTEAENREAAVIPMPERTVPPHDARRSG